MRRSRTLGFALLVVSGLAAGCGQSDGPSVPSTGAAVTASPASSEKPVVGSGRKKAAKKSGSRKGAAGEMTILFCRKFCEGKRGLIV